MRFLRLIIIGLISIIFSWIISFSSSNNLAAEVGKQQFFSLIPIISVDGLPIEAKNTIQLIAKGGPFPYEKDGTIFNNREQKLPIAYRGYYREYTVPTPGLKHRGPRRIVTGEQTEHYYTKDHYQSFFRIKF